jgi:hypothetical protein
MLPQIRRSPGMIRVNIHTVGRIPWINIVGPKYDVSISPTIYRLLKRDSRIDIRTVEEDEAANVKIETPVVEQTAKSEKPVETIKVEDNITITKIEEPKNIVKEVEDALLDAEIEKRLNELPVEDPFTIRMDTEETKKVNLKKYSNKQLDKLTREQMFQILFDRGHTGDEDPMKPKYHDTKPMLVKKVKDTQKFL